MELLRWDSWLFGSMPWTMSEEWSPGSGLSISVADGSGSTWLDSGISGLGGCRVRRGRPLFLFNGGAETGMVLAVVRVLLELQRLGGVRGKRKEEREQCVRLMDGDNCWPFFSYTQLLRVGSWMSGGRGLQRQGAERPKALDPMCRWI